MTKGVKKIPFYENKKKLRVHEQVVIIFL